MQLDLLRGVAILMVIGRHSPIHPLQTGHFFVLSGLWARFGWTGVDLFFVLSGFLVGGLLFRELRQSHRLDTARFLIRRGLKIWPAYFVYLGYVFVTLLVTSHGAWKQSFSQIVPNLLHTQNYFGSPRGHTWSLAVEEHFYLLLPCLLLLLTRRRVSREPPLTIFPILALSVAGICTAWRCWIIVFHRPWSGEVLCFPTHLRIDSLFFGVLLAYFYHFKPHLLARITRNRWALLGVGILLVSPMMVLRIKTAMFVPAVGFTMLYIGYGCILLALLYTPPGEGILGKLMMTPLARAVAFIGTFSYSIYLWHIDVGYTPLHYLLEHGFLKNSSLEARWFVVMTLYVSSSTLAGIVLGNMIERPTLALRDRLFPAKARSL